MMPMLLLVFTIFLEKYKELGANTLADINKTAEVNILKQPIRNVMVLVKKSEDQEFISISFRVTS